ncbi:hypothetical protein CIP107532_00139 [Corynebacterium diphtheriae]|nr:hypothetical protein CIP107532_00139 [Corynebacterium diphtheriae]
MSHREDLALCRQQQWRTGTSPWDSRLAKESTPEMLARHAQAKTLCFTCPLLEECERMLQKFEAEGLRIDGVIAGRYCDVRGRGSIGIEDTLTNCLVCGSQLEPRSGFKVKRPPRKARAHAGEGLCTECYQTFSREVRQSIKL